MHRLTTAIITATVTTMPLHEWDISTKTHVQIDRSLRPAERMSLIILRLWGFLCVRDAGRRGNKITEKDLRQSQVTMVMQIKVVLCLRCFFTLHS